MTPPRKREGSPGPEPGDPNGRGLAETGPARVRPASGGAEPRDPKSIVTPDAFSVSPELLGAPLAPPRRRLAAILLDLMFVGLLEALSWRLLLGGAVLMLFLVVARRPDAGRLRRAAVGCGGMLLVAATVFVTFVPALWRAGFLRPDGFPPADVPSVVAQDEAQAGDETRAAAGGVAETDGADGLADSAAPLSSIGVAIREGVRVGDSVAQAAEAGEEDPAAAAPEPPSTAFAWVRDFADEAGLIFGWGTIYLTLFTALWKGRTPGKRLLDLRVVTLTGEPLGLLRAFERAGGYAAGFATGLFGFARVWWDPNRQAIHDKIAETVVVRESLSRRKR